MKYFKSALPNALIGTLLWLGTARATTVTYSYPGADCLAANSDPTTPHAGNLTNTGFYIHYENGFAAESDGDLNTPRDHLECPLIKHSGFHHIASVTVTISGGVEDLYPGADLEEGPGQSCYIASGDADGGTDVETELITLPGLDYEGVGTATTALDAYEYDYYWINCHNLNSDNGVYGFQVTEESD